MAIHVKHTAQNTREKVRRARRRLTATSASISAFFMIVLLLVLANIGYIILGDQDASFISYTPQSDEIQQTDEPQQRKRLSGGLSAAPSTIQPEILTADVASDFALDTSDLTSELTGTGDMEAQDSGSAGIGLGLGEGLDLGEGIGEGLGGGGGLGSRNATPSSLAGTLYDLKTYKSGQPSNLAEDEQNLGMANLLARFYSHGWNQSMLGRYKAAPTQLYTSCFYVPNCMDAEAPYAYDCADTMEPSRWMAVYRGEVQAPKSGYFRFLGIGDSTLGIRFDNRNVLQCGFHTLDRHADWNMHRKNMYEKGVEFKDCPGTDYWRRLFSWTEHNLILIRDESLLATLKAKIPERICKKTGKKVTKEVPKRGGAIDPGSVPETETIEEDGTSCEPTGRMIDAEGKRYMMDSLYCLRHDLVEGNYLPGGLQPGTVFKVNEGEWYDFQLLISEIGGGYFGFCVYIEEVDERGNPLHPGSPRYQIFRTSMDQPNPHEFYQNTSVEIPEVDRTYPEYDPDSYIWPARHRK